MIALFYSEQPKVPRSRLRVVVSISELVSTINSGHGEAAGGAGPPHHFLWDLCT